MTPFRAVTLGPNTTSRLVDPVCAVGRRAEEWTWLWHSEQMELP